MTSRVDLPWTVDGVDADLADSELLTIECVGEFLSSIRQNTVTVKVVTFRIGLGTTLAQALAGQPSYAAGDAITGPHEVSP